MTKQMIENKFSNTLKAEGIAASVTLTNTGVNICVESQDLVEKVKTLMAKVKTVVFDGIDHYAADEDMPAEWYIRYNFA